MSQKVHNSLSVEGDSVLLVPVTSDCDFEYQNQRRSVRIQVPRLLPARDAVPLSG